MTFGRLVLVTVTTFVLAALAAAMFLHRQHADINSSIRGREITEKGASLRSLGESRARSSREICTTRDLADVTFGGYGSETPIKVVPASAGRLRKPRPESEVMWEWMQYAESQHDAKARDTAFVNMIEAETLADLQKNAADPRLLFTRTAIPNDLYYVFLTGTDMKRGTGIAGDVAAETGWPGLYERRLIRVLGDPKYIPDGANVVLVGHSLGGMVAQQAASSNRAVQRFGSITIITFGSPPVGHPVSVAMIQRFAGPADLVAKINSFEAVQQWPVWLLTIGKGVSDHLSYPSGNDMFSVSDVHASGGVSLSDIYALSHPIVLQEFDIFGNSDPLQGSRCAILDGKAGWSFGL